MVTDGDDAEAKAKSISLAIFTTSARFYVAASSNNHPSIPEHKTVYHINCFIIQFPWRWICDVSKWHVAIFKLNFDNSRRLFDALLVFPYYYS
jgi:hypothetical protein